MNRKWVILAILIGISAISAPRLAYTRGLFSNIAQKFSGTNISPSELREDVDGSSLLSVGKTGRYAIQSKSGSGVNIELIDMIAGPVDASGSPGLRDGRIDALLEAGVYKIRLHGVKGAKGKASLDVEPFVEANSTKPNLVLGQINKDQLTDLQQRSYGLDVSSTQPIIIEVAGRSLHDVRIWQDDGSLTSLKTTRRVTETNPGHAVNNYRLQGQLAPGHYTVTAYGGEKQAWSDASTDEPLFIRLSEIKPLAAGVIIGKISPFGAELIEAPSQYNSFRLELPQAAPVTISAERNGIIQTGRIDKTNRSPWTIIALDVDDKTNARLEISGYEGQAYKVEAIRYSNQATYQVEGLYKVQVDLAGDGGDEPSAAALFAHVEPNGSYRVLASNTPKVGPGLAWRSKFNFIGPTSLLFEVTEKGPIFLDIKGLKYRLSLAPALGSFTPRADGAAPLNYDLNPGFYLLSLQPESGAGGVLDVTIGPPGTQAPTPQAAEPRSFISLGEHKLEKGGYYIILSNVAHQLLTGPRIFSSPLTIDNTSFSFKQEPNKDTILDLQIPSNTRLIATNEMGEKINYTVLNEKYAVWRSLTIKIPASSVGRTIGLMSAPQFSSPSASQQQDTSNSSLITPNKPAYFDLDLNDSKYFRIDVTQGGLYRIETLGRLQTSLNFGSTILKEIGSADQNGPGGNAQLAAFLRAGSYYADVSVEGTAGHLGLAISPIALTSSAKIKDEGVIASVMSPDKGLIIPLEITQAGAYELDLIGLNRRWAARIEDGEGWPIKRPGPLTHDIIKFEPGSYRLVVSPEALEGRIVAKLHQVKAIPELEGHGPHKLSFDAPKKLQWREPLDKNAPRVPDQWQFKLYGTSDIRLSISEGMIADVFNSNQELVGKATQDRPLDMNLPASDYRIEARSLAHDDRVDYEISLSSPQLQPDSAQELTLPVSLDFSLDKPQIVDISSFGHKEVIGVIKTSTGNVLERIRNNSSNWNLSFSKRLPQGKYKLEVEELNIKKVSQGASINEESDETDYTEDTNSQETENTDTAKTIPNETQIRFSILEETKEISLPIEGKTVLEGTGAHNIRIEQGKPDTLTLFTAQAALETALSLERREPGGSEWKSVGFIRGVSPTLAFPASEEKADWRVLAWTIGGLPSQISLTTQSVDLRESHLGKVALQPVKGAATSLCVGKIDAPNATLIDISAETPIFAGSSPGLPLHLVTDGVFAPQNGAVWLLSQGDCGAKLSISALDLTDKEIFLDLAENEKAQLPPLSEPTGTTRIIVAHAAFAQPLIESNKGSAIAPGSAIALVGSKSSKIWRADEVGPMRFSIQSYDLKNQKPIKTTSNFNGVIAPMSAQIVEISETEKLLSIDLSRGLAAFIDQRGAYANDTSLSRVYHSAGETVLLVNPTDKPLSAQITRLAESSSKIDNATTFKRFIGASGEISLPLNGSPGDQLSVVGGDTTVIFENGRVLRGNEINLEGNGEAIIHHKPGLIAAWIEHQGMAPWPRSETKEITPPQRISMDGAAMRLSIKQTSPIQLHITSETPALISFSQNNRHSTYAFASGIDFHQYVAAGDATIEIISPHAGSLTGTLDVSSQPIHVAKEGINDPVVISSGGSTLFSFDATREAEIGLGLRADPDRITAKLLDAQGNVIGEGIAQKIKVKPGRYFIEARTPADAGATTVRLTLLGISPPPASPPEEVVSELLDKIGMKKLNKK